MRHLVNSLFADSAIGTKFLTVTFPFVWTGDKNVRDLFNLIDAIHLPLCRPEYNPQGGETHCNQYVAEVCEIYGFKGFQGILANQIIDLLASHSDWSPMPMEKAQDAANSGTLIIAGLKANPHGHVCVVCPGKAKTSGRWGQVPSVANVGQTIFVGKGINWAFSDFPRLWAWRSTLG